MSKRFSLSPVDEPAAPTAVERLGALLSESSGWIGPFIVLLDGMGFDRPPSMTPGAAFFDMASRHDDRGRQILSALDDAYADVRDGENAAEVHGHILERFVFHSLARAFPDRLGACEVLCDGSQYAAYRLDAGTAPESPCAGVEAKTSTRALKKGGAARAKAVQKAAWVTTLHLLTGEEVAGVWATWVPEDRFRSVLRNLIGGDADRAFIVGHERLRQVGPRLRNLVQLQARAIERREREEAERS